MVEQNKMAKQEQPKDDVVGKTLGFKNPADSVGDFEKFMFEETPYVMKHVVANALHKASGAAMADKVGSDDVRTDIRNGAAEYFIGKMLGTSLSADSMTKNLSLKYMFETATGMTDELLADLFKDGKDISSESLLQLGNQASRTYNRWAGNMMMTNLRGAVKSKDGRSALEGKVLGWDNQFSLGIKKETLIDNEKLIESYLSGANRNQEYLGTQNRAPYRPGN